MLDGKVAEGDNDMQCVKPKYSTRQVACSGSVGKSLLRESFSDIIQVVSLKLFKKLVTSWRCLRLQMRYVAFAGDSS
jgi:hypothetical protein